MKYQEPADFRDDNQLVLKVLTFYQVRAENGFLIYMSTECAKI